VLVVEDDAASRLLLQQWLQGAGHEVIVAKDGLSPELLKGQCEQCDVHDSGACIMTRD